MARMQLGAGLCIVTSLITSVAGSLARFMAACSSGAKLGFDGSFGLFGNTLREATVHV